jgi:carotenoid cleavage dioxygenase-like enzyme
LGVAGEFPVSDPRRAERPRCLTTHITAYDDAGPFPRAVATSDWQSGRGDTFGFGTGQLIKEFQYGPGNSAREGNGGLIGSTLNLKSRASEMHLLRAGDVALPITFHGIFVGA